MRLLKRFVTCVGICLVSLVWSTASAQAELPPTHQDVSYGPHKNHVLDFWQAKGDEPSPVIVYIHGGGFRGGDKSQGRSETMIQACLDSGVSFAAINYRFRPEVPIQDILRDSGRAIQFLRSQAEAWKIDKPRIAAYGGSAGAGTSIWLAYHDDLSDPDNSDPILRESSRLTAAGSIAGQFSYDLLEWSDVLGVPVERFHTEIHKFYGLENAADLQTDAGKSLRADVDMRGLISSDDPPVYLITCHKPGTPKDRKHYNHHPLHAAAIEKRCSEQGTEATWSKLTSKAPTRFELLLRNFFFEKLEVKKTAKPQK